MGDKGEGHGIGRSHAHLCQVFDDHTEFRAAVVEFLADGLARGARVRHIGPADAESLRADLAPLMRMPQADRPGAVEVVSVVGTYAGPDACVDAQTQVASYAADTQAALADGFTGFRVAAEVTMLVRTPAQLDAFARYEHQADRLMTRMQFTAMCGYRRAELGDDAVGQLACLHPAGGDEQAPFRITASRDADVALSGELDLTTVDSFAVAVDRTGVLRGPAEVVVDAAGLEFADHRNLLVLQRMAERYGRTVVLRTARRWPARLVAALELTRVRVDTSRVTPVCDHEGTLCDEQHPLIPR